MATTDAQNAPNQSAQASGAAAARRMKSSGSSRVRYIWLAIYIVFLMIPLLWLIKMSFQTTSNILGTFRVIPLEPTLENYARLLSNPTWYGPFINSIWYVTLNTLISLTVALPGAYAFSRYNFVGDKHLFFWLLTNRMAPPAVFLLPFFQLYKTVGLFDTHIGVALAHCLFNVPLAVWILEGFMSGVPREVDETAYIDGYSWPRFFVTIFIPLIKAGVGVTAFFCFMFSWVELLLAQRLTQTNATPVGDALARASGGATGTEWGLVAAIGSLTLIPGAVVIYFVRKNIAKGFALGRV